MTASSYFFFLSFFLFDGDELRRLCVFGEGGGHSGTLLCCPAVTLLWNDVTARKWRRTGSHYWSFSNYFILNKYSRKLPWQELQVSWYVSQLRFGAKFEAVVQFVRCSGSLTTNSFDGPWFWRTVLATKIVEDLVETLAMLMLANAAPCVCYVKCT